MDLDDTDRAIIDALLADGRASIRDLADEADVAVETAERRIETLEDAGVIDGYTATIDYDELGYDVTAVVRLRVEKPTEFSDSLGPWARSVYEVTGTEDLVIVGAFRDTGAVHGTVARLVTDPGVESVTVDVIVDSLRTNEPIRLDDAND